MDLFSLHANLLPSLLSVYILHAYSQSQNTTQLVLTKSFHSTHTKGIKVADIIKLLRWLSKTQFWWQVRETLPFNIRVLFNKMQCCCSVAQLCPTLCDTKNCGTPGFPILHHLPELAQTHVHWVSDTIQPSHPLSSPSTPAFNRFQHQGLF